MGISAVIMPDTIRNYRRLSYEYWFALAEFVDNSTQSYYSNRVKIDASLDERGERFQVRIVHDKDQGVIRVTDNAYGMDHETLRNALVHGKPPADTSGRHEFGMGLKTAASWIGDLWTIRTTALGNNREYSIEYDVERVASGDLDLREQEREVDPGLHYTILEIRKLHRGLATRTISKTKEYLRSIYRIDTGSGAVELLWGDETLDYTENLEFLAAADGSLFRKEFDFEVNGKRVTGWGGILESGGRPKAGFAIVRRGRVIKGQPEAWRPSSLYGQTTGSNDLVNQRLIGEIHLNTFLASQQKDAILWEGDDEDLLEKELLEVFKDYKQTALERRKRGGGPSAHVTAAALDDVATVISSPAFVDSFDLVEIPSQEAVRHSQDHVIDSVADGRGDKEVRIGDILVRIYLSHDLSPNDPYFAAQIPGDALLVVVNANHPFFVDNLSSHESVVAYLVHCVYDALAEWKCASKMGTIEPNTVKMIKDQFLREPFGEI